MMSKRRTGFTADLLAGRTALLELIIATIILALSVEFIAASLLNLTAGGDWRTLAAGALFGAIALTLLFRRFLQTASNRSASFDGVIVYMNEGNAVVDIPRYHYGSELHRYLHAAFTENPALKTLWDKEPLSGAFAFDREKGAMTRINAHGMQLIREATEYYVLSRLSTHLTDYFNDDDFEKGRLMEYSREDVSDILLKNRFMDLFSRPMDQRAPFVGDSMNPPPHGKVVAVYGIGVLYEEFDLVLPFGSSVVRGPNGTIRIETPKLVLSVQVVFDGMNTVLPRGFEEYYLGLKDHRSYTDYKITLHTHVHFKWHSFFSGAGWDYYRWVDSFIETLESNFDEDHFIQELSWPAVLTLIELFRKNQSNMGLDHTVDPPSGTPAGQP